MNRADFAKAFVGLICFDLMLRLAGFAEVHRKVEQWRIKRGDKIDPGTVDRICQAVNYACSWYPKRVLCLQRSVVTTCLLRNGGIPAQLVLGAQKLPFKAHAWVEVEGAAVNESADVRAIYAVWERC
jgi:hypothetical protein